MALVKIKPDKRARNKSDHSPWTCPIAMSLSRKMKPGVSVHVTPAFITFLSRSNKDFPVQTRIGTSWEMSEWIRAYDNYQDPSFDEKLWIRIPDEYLR